MLNYKLDQLQDLHKDQPCFVVASGTSLHGQPIKELKDSVCITINAGIAKAPFADYFLTDDHDIQYWNYWNDILPNNDSKVLLYQRKPWSPINHIHKDRIYWFDHKCWYDNITDKYYADGLLFTKEATEPLIGARNSAGSAVHLAYIMGCDPIILLGCDCCFVDNKKYFWQFEGEPKVEKSLLGPPALMNPVYKTADYNGFTVDAYFFDFLKYWKALSKQAKEQKINILNASGGALDCFENIDIYDAIDKFVVKGV